MKKALMVATVYKFLNFEKSDMEILKKLGYEVHSATNMEEADWLKDDGTLDYLELKKHQIDFGRSPFSGNSVTAYKQLKKLFREQKFDIIHCHTPVAAAITRLAAIEARKNGAKVIYTSHGFHFHKSSKKRNWLIYYPIEYIMAYFTDMIITINQEDYSVIKRFPVKEKRYIPGVGVDIEYIANIPFNKEEIRRKYGIPEEAFVIISIGELSDRKNHQVIIKALSKLKDDKFYYIICGTGERKEFLEEKAIAYGVNDRVIFAGQQSHDEVLRLCHASDIGALPSLIEGLGLAGIETLASGKPLIASNVHGIKDYVINEETGVTVAPFDVLGFSEAIKKLKENSELYQKCCKNALLKAKEFDIENAKKLMRENYALVDERQN